MPDHPGWRVRARVQLDDGALIVRDLWVQPQTGRERHDGTSVGTTPDGGLTTEILRSIPLSRLRRILVEHPRLHEIVGAMYGPEHVAELERARRPGRKGRDVAFYAGWAAEYVDAAATSRRPNAVLAERHGESVATVREFIRQARDRDLLIGGHAGKAGGALTPKAKRLLDKQRKAEGSR